MNRSKSNWVAQTQVELCYPGSMPTPVGTCPCQVESAQSYVEVSQPKLRSIQVDIEKIELNHLEPKSSWVFPCTGQIGILVNPSVPIPRLSWVDLKLERVGLSQAQVKPSHYGPKLRQVCLTQVESSLFDLSQIKLICAQVESIQLMCRWNWVSLCPTRSWVKSTQPRLTQVVPSPS